MPEDDRWSERDTVDLVLGAAVSEKNMLGIEVEDHMQVAPDKHPEPMPVFPPAGSEDLHQEIHRQARRALDAGQSPSPNKTAATAEPTGLLGPRIPTVEEFEKPLEDFSTE